MRKSLITSLAVAALVAAVSSLLSMGVSAGPLRAANDRTFPTFQIITGAYQASYGAGPRIIHVPQSEDAVAEGDDRDNAGARETGVIYMPPPPAETQPPVRKVRPAPCPRSEAPRVKRHTVTSAPPPNADEMDKAKDTALSPVYPTPNFGGAAKGGEKFDPQPRQD